MKNAFARWFVSLFILSFILCGASLSCKDSNLTHQTEGDDSLVLPEDEPEHLVAMTGKLQMCIFNSDAEDAESPFLHRWIMKLNPESLEIACRTPVRASFQTPTSIRSFRNCDEMELTDGYDEEWLLEHLNQNITVKGYLWHAHTGHHRTPVMIDSEPWFK
jgi:hypothetical protein